MGTLYVDHADLYDAAFSWDIAAEADWLVERFGPSARTVLEPGCGSGRLFPGLTRRGLEVVGLDLSEPMLARARERMRREELPEPRIVLADMSSFDLGERFDGAVCPINTFKHLTTDDQARGHLAAMGRHLVPGARYLVMVDLADRQATGRPGTATWNMDHPSGHGTLRCSWSGGEIDWGRRLEIQVSRFEVRGGPDDGESNEFRHEVRAWDWRAWRELVGESPFAQTGAFDGNANGQPPLEVGPSLEGRPLVWHELTLN